MDAEHTICEIEWLERIFAVPDTRPLSAHDLSAANRRHDEMNAHGPWFQAKSYFEKGVKTRETGNHYVKISVFLATVLLLTALGQRFGTMGPRIVVLCVAFTLLIIATFWIVTFPRV
jgi:hypothetical protein